MTALPTLLAELWRYATALAGDEWQLQDGCSWRRIGSGGRDGNILHPTNHRIDGHPDLSAAENVLAYIIKAQPNHILALLAHIDALEKRCGKLDSLLTELYALVVGECPSLLNEDSGGSERLDAEICAALAEQGEPK